MVLVASISDEAARKAQRLVQRLAVAKPQKDVATNAHIMDKQLCVASLKIAKNEVHGKEEPSEADKVAPAGQVGRRPWRVGVPPTGLVESR